MPINYTTNKKLNVKKLLLT